jgi:hypothetical protein
MKTQIAAFLVLVFLSASPLGTQASPANLERLAWMSGHWNAVSGSTEVEEHWTAPAGNTMIGMGRTVVHGETRSFEYLRIVRRPDGIFYIAQPQGAPPTEFKLVRLEGRSAVFENREHDFPKRILYRKEADGGLTARVEGTPEQKKLEEEFRYRRMK